MSRRARPRLSASAPRGVTPERWAAFRTVVRTLRDEAWTDRTWSAEADRAGLDGRRRGQGQRLAFGAVQQAAPLDHVIAVVGKRPVRKLDPEVHAALRLGVFQLLMSDGISDHAAVNETVETVRAAVGERPVAFANAVLRRAQVDGHTVLARLDDGSVEGLAARLSYPAWLVEALVADHGAERARAALEAMNGGSGVGAGSATMRVNMLRAPELAPDEAPTVAGVGVPELVRVDPSDPRVAEQVERGLLHPQSAASMVVAHVVAPKPGERVADLCAAPGGKTTHLAALMEGRGLVCAWELHEHRAESIRTLASLLGAANVSVEVGDATRIEDRLDGSFDRVLVDAPCSGSGVLGRRPDARWRIDPQQVTELSTLQRALLARAARLVRPGGVVVYSTCSLLRAEGEQVVAGAESVGLRPAGEALRTWPQHDATDGFFIARLERPA